MIICKYVFIYSKLNSWKVISRFSDDFKKKTICSVYRDKIVNWVRFIIFQYCFIFCIQACASGMYGQNCSVPCGNCLPLEQCHHINGTCMNGCASGYKGSRCTEGENNNFDIVRYIIYSWLTTLYFNYIYIFDRMWW